MQKRQLLLILMIALTPFSLQADEGMWLLKELNEQSVARMKELGFNFPIEKIYDENNPSLKDAVVIFGGGCTGVAVSDKGLIFTNHHCGYGAIQKLSSVEHDYLKDGFASQANEQELPAEGLEIAFLKHTEDITEQIVSQVSNDISEEERFGIIDSLSNIHLAKYADNPFLRASVVPFYSHNKYYMVVYEVFKDIRLVFTPPSSIGKFGGDTDNWMWPRHTGDFSVFRVYANANNEASMYNQDNVPYSPKYSVPISLKGYQENDYAMTIGYPGRTQRYMTSMGITQKVEAEHKPRIEVRGIKQAIWKTAMNADDATRIKYSNKYAGSSNYWKNAMGMNEAIQKLEVVEGKRQLENDFETWANQTPARKAKYGTTLHNIDSAHLATMDFTQISTYFYETFYNGIEVVRFARSIDYMQKSEMDDKEYNLRKRLTDLYKDYDPKLDQVVMPSLLRLYGKRIPTEYLPSIYHKIANQFGGNYEKYAEWFYKQTKTTDLDSAIALVNQADISDDPAIELAKSLEECAMKITSNINLYYTEIVKGNRLFMAGLMEMNPNKAFYPDANFTQRLSYGVVEGYSPDENKRYNYYTTSPEILNKYIPGDSEFDIQSYIREDIEKGNFGEYADKDGTLHINFLSNNDITGGNSGSPVFNGNAELLGLAFDGNWEALSGDILFDQKVQRCINVDIRYALYIIDQVMKCPRILDELTIVK